MNSVLMPSRSEPMETCDLSDRERELAAILKAYSDVTDRLKTAHERLNDEVSRLRDELRRKNEELRRRDRLAALGEMAAGLAHEVRNPLGGIALYASMLERELEGNEKGQLAASRISNGVRSLNRLVTEILDFAQEDHLEKQVVALGVVYAEVDDALRPWVQQHGVEIRVDASMRGVSLSCDASRMQRVLLNLLLNGMQAAGEGGWVSLAARRTASDDRRSTGVRIEVVDSGTGIPADALDRIFNPFFTTKSSGTGLGLAIVHRIVEAHGGTIRAMNSAEAGAKFVVWIPDDANSANADLQASPCKTANSVHGT